MTLRTKAQILLICSTACFLLLLLTMVLPSLVTIAGVSLGVMLGITLSILRKDVHYKYPFRQYFRSDHDDLPDRDLRIQCWCIIASLIICCIFIILALIYQRSTAPSAIMTGTVTGAALRILSQTR